MGGGLRLFRFYFLDDIMKQVYPAMDSDQNSQVIDKNQIRKFEKND
jgi:hypothetical protein